MWGHHGLWHIGVELNFQVEMAEWEGEEAGEGEAWAGGDSCPLGFPGQQCPPSCQHCALQGPGGWSAPLSFEWSSTQSIDDVPCSGLEMTIAWWRKNYFLVVFVFTCYGSDFSCFDMTAKMCTAFPCHRQTYFQHACFHAESEGSISLA